MKRKTLVTISMVVFMALSTGAVIAYFSRTLREPLGSFATGSTEVLVTAQSVTSQDLLPGQEQMFEYSIQNTGTVPVNAVALLDGAWSDPALDPVVVRGVKMSVMRGGNEFFLKNSAFAPEAEIFFSDSGTDEDVWELQPGEVWDVDVTLALDQTTGEEFMLANYQLDAVVGVKESGTSAPWPVLQ
jgi:hypothetical protein